MKSLNQLKKRLNWEVQSCKDLIKRTERWPEHMRSTKQQARLEQAKERLDYAETLRDMRSAQRTLVQRVRFSKQRVNLFAVANKARQELDDFTSDIQPLREYLGV